jgi:hypothetical protein
MRDPSIYDHLLAKHNPWGLTPHQCMVMRLHCKLGHTKLIWRLIDMPVKTINGHIENIRVKMKLPGHDVRIFTWWALWARQFHQSNYGKETYLPEAPTETEQPMGVIAGADHASHH